MEKTGAAPMIRREFQLPCRPQALEELAAKYECCLLYSGGLRDSAQRSVFALHPIETVSLKGEDDPWKKLKSRLGSLEDDSSLPLWFGYLGYEMGATADPEKPLYYRESVIPTAQFQRYALVLDWGREGQVRLTADLEQLPAELRTYTEEGPWRALMERKEKEPTEVFLTELIAQSESLETYLDKVDEAKEHILAGDIYQVNLSQEFTLRTAAQPFSLFCQLAEKNPASFSAFIRTEDFAIISSSPERFIKRKGDQLETRPIKGTCPRGINPADDAQRREALMHCPKNRAELLMITDLMRNDLSRVSIPGTVNTTELLRCEAYQNVHHLLSVIQSRLKPGQHSLDILRACFPGGSITGCPKLRSMEIIDELEQRPRGVYTGSIGYFRANGDFDFNVAIRTILARHEQLTVAVGGAITADSDPIEEWNETLHKGRSIFEVLGCEHSLLDKQMVREAWRTLA